MAARTRIHWAIMGSALAHVALLGLILAGLTGRAMDDPSTPAGAASTSSATSGPSTEPSSPATPSAPERSSSTVPTPAELDRMLEAEIDQAANLSDAAKRGELERADATLRAMDAGAVDAIAGLIESTAGVTGKPDRAFEPRDGVQGRFEADSAVIHDIVRLEPDPADPASAPAFRWTVVDRDGRSLSYEIAAADMTPSQMLTFAAFEIARQNPNMRRALDAAMRIADERSQGDAAVSDP